MDNQTALKFLEVNDDCLREIFKYLADFELADVASTCNRCQIIARDVFSLRQKPDLVCSLTEESDPHSCCHRQHTTAFLRNFGDLLLNVKVTFCYGKTGKFNNTTILNLMTRYCAGTVEYLDLVNCSYLLQPDEIIDASELFRNIKVLVLENSSAINRCLLSDAKQLTELTLIGFHSKKINKILSNDYPQLEALILRNPSHCWNLGRIDNITFLKRHPNLTKLILNGFSKCDLLAIGECSWLRELTIWNCKDCDFSPIAQLANLTVLKLSTVNRSESAIELLKTSMSHQSLENLRVSFDWADGKALLTVLLRFNNLKQLAFYSKNDIDDDVLSYLHRLEKLRVLSFGGDQLVLTSNGLMELMRQLPELERYSLFAYYDYMELLESTYLQICEICRGRNQKLMIYNFDLINGNYSKLKRVEPFAASNHREFARYFTIDYNELEENQDSVRI